jgi:hypothetical protein
MFKGALDAVMVHRRRWGLEFVAHELLLHLGLIARGDCANVPFELEMIGGTWRACHVDTCEVLCLYSEAARCFYGKRYYVTQHLLAYLG